MSHSLYHRNGNTENSKCKWKNFRYVTEIKKNYSSEKEISGFFVQNCIGRCLIKDLLQISFSKILLDFNQIQFYWSFPGFPATLFKKETLAQMFFCEFCQISQNTFLQNTSGRLLLHICFLREQIFLDWFSCKISGSAEGNYLSKLKANKKGYFERWIKHLFNI